MKLVLLLASILGTSNAFVPSSSFASNYLSETTSLSATRAVSPQKKKVSATVAVTPKKKFDYPSFSAFSKSSPNKDAPKKTTASGKKAVVKAKVQKNVTPKKSFSFSIASSKTSPKKVVAKKSPKKVVAKKSTPKFKKVVVT